MPSRPVLAAITAVYLLAVAWLTLGPQPVERSDGVLAALLRTLAGHPLTAWIDYDVVEFTANIALFVPAGVLFTLLLGARRWGGAVLLGAAMTLAIETAQLALPDRVADPRDLVANTAGALLGAAGTMALSRARRRPSRPAR